MRCVVGGGDGGNLRLQGPVPESRLSEFYHLTHEGGIQGRGPMELPILTTGSW
jgi:hypothetical protein